MPVADASAGGGLSLAGGVRFALSGLSEFVRSAGSSLTDTSRISVGGEITDSGRLAAADWLNRVASWASVTQTALAQSLSVGWHVAMESLPTRPHRIHV